MENQCAHHDRSRMFQKPCGPSFLSSGPGASVASLESSLASSTRGYLVKLMGFWGNLLQNRVSCQENWSDLEKYAVEKDEEGGLIQRIAEIGKMVNQWKIREE